MTDTNATLARSFADLRCRNVVRVAGVHIVIARLVAIAHTQGIA